MSFLWRLLAAGRGRGVGQVGSRGALLRAGVHVALVVQAHVDHVLVAFGRSGQRLEADVVGAAVAGDHQHVHVGLAAAVQPPLDAGRRRGARLQGGVKGGYAERAERLRARDGGDARRRRHRDGLGPHRVQDVADGQGLAAAGTRAVPGTEDRRLLDLVVRIGFVEPFSHRTHLCHTDPATGSSTQAFSTISRIMRTGTFTPPTPAR